MKMPVVQKGQWFGGGLRDAGRLDRDGKAHETPVARRRLPVLATLVAAIALASPIAASARDYPQATSKTAAKFAAATNASKQPSRDKQRPSDDRKGGAETRAAWGS
jgi:hypothetical protein